MINHSLLHDIQRGDRDFARMLSLPFTNIRCRATSALVLCATTYFLLATLGGGTQPAFTAGEIAILYQRGLPAILMALLIWILARIERFPLSVDALGLSPYMPQERKSFVLLYLGLMALAGLLIGLFLGYFKYAGVPIHQISPQFPLDLSQLHAGADAMWSTRAAPMLFHALSVLVLAPIIEEIYITGIVFPALRNRFGFAAGAGAAASIFALLYCGTNLWTGQGWLPFTVIAGAQIASFTLYQGTRSLYPSIASHVLRNATLLFIQLSALL